MILLNVKIICQNNRRYVRCESYFHFSNVFKLHSNSNKLPEIATKDGTIFREKIVKTHLNSKGHIEAAKAQRIAALPKLQAATPIRKAFATEQLRLANKIGKLMLHVYHDAKSVTLSVHSFPSRVVVGELGNSFQYDCPVKSKPTLDLQYLSVNSHSEMLSCIVLSDKKTLQKTLLKALAISLRCDGSVDRTQLDKIYLMAKLVSPTVWQKMCFLWLLSHRQMVQRVFMMLSLQLVQEPYN